MGVRIGGRKAGTPNRKTVDLQDKLTRMDCDPREVMALIVVNKLPCGVCRGTGMTRYKKPLKPRVECPDCGNQAMTPFVKCTKCGGEPAQELGDRTCMSCYGTLMEACPPKLRGEMAAELLNYLLPKRKAIEHSGKDGGAIVTAIEVVMVAARDGKRA